MKEGLDGAAAGAVAAHARPDQAKQAMVGSILRNMKEGLMAEGYVGKGNDRSRGADATPRYRSRAQAKGNCRDARRSAGRAGARHA